MKKILFAVLTTVLLWGCSKEEIYPPVDNPSAEIQTFTLVTEAGVNAISSITINSNESLITIKTNLGISANRLFPTAVISEGALVKPAMGVYTDFTKPVVYAVTAGNRANEKVWTVKVN